MWVIPQLPLKLNLAPSKTLEQTLKEIPRRHDWMQLAKGYVFLIAVSVIWFGDIGNGRVVVACMYLPTITLTHPASTHGGKEMRTPDDITVMGACSVACSALGAIQVVLGGKHEGERGKKNQL